MYLNIDVMASCLVWYLLLYMRLLLKVPKNGSAKWLSSTAEFYRYTLTEPYLNFATHTALVIQLLQIQSAGGQRDLYFTWPRFSAILKLSLHALGKI